MVRPMRPIPNENDRIHDIAAGPGINRETMLNATSRTLASCLVLAAFASGACAKSGTDKLPADSSAAAAPAMSRDTGMAGMSHGDSGMAGMSNMAGMTGNPDHDFLRLMSDHHKGMIALAHATIDRKDASASVRAEARTFDRKQDAELDTMTTMLEQSFKDPYTPKITPENQAMIDSTLAKTGPAFDRAFRETVIKHHQGAVKMVDEYLPKLTDAKLKTMAQRMRSDQQREISQLQQQIGKA
ncbi:MAG: hypothetical protein JWL95_2498 [Gemmatimonadetes bacterium]|nr:hypothetical protein [Gemmatimonadota bacterium]